MTDHRLTNRQIQNDYYDGTMMDTAFGYFVAFFTNPILLSVIVAFVFCQTTKVILLTRKAKQFRTSFLCADGHMPSSHSATVTGLATAVLFAEGLSTLFFVCFVLWFIVIRDALGIRYQASLHAVYFNRLARRLNEKSIPALVEELGHTLPQVVVGVLIGIVAASVVFLMA